MSDQLNAFIRHITGTLCETLMMCCDSDTQIKEIRLKQTEINAVHNKLGQGHRVLMAFAKHVLPHRDEIFNENEKFFIDDMDYSTVHSKQFNIKSEESVELAGYVKDVWATLDEKKKKRLWICFKVACNLADKAIAVNLNLEPADSTVTK